MDTLINFTSFLLYLAGGTIAFIFIVLFLSVLSVVAVKAFRLLLALFNFSIAEPEAAIIRKTQSLNIQSAKKAVKKKIKGMVADKIVVPEPKIKKKSKAALKIILVLFAALMLSSSAMAAGTCVHTSTTEIRTNAEVISRVVTLTCTGDGTITAFSFNPSTYSVEGWFLYSVTTDPDATSAPAADYDITLLINGEDIAGGLLADRSATATQTVCIAPTTKNYRRVKDTMSITFANQTANPSIIVLTLTFEPK